MSLGFDLQLQLVPQSFLPGGLESTSGARRNALRDECKRILRSCIRRLPRRAIVVGQLSVVNPRTRAHNALKVWASLARTSSVPRQMITVLAKGGSWVDLEDSDDDDLDLLLPPQAVARATAAAKTVPSRKADRSPSPTPARSAGAASSDSVPRPRPSRNLRLTPPGPSSKAGRTTARAGPTRSAASLVKKRANRRVHRRLQMAAANLDSVPRPRPSCNPRLTPPVPTSKAGKVQRR